MRSGGKKQKHIPQRTCVICRSVIPKRELTRIVRTSYEGVQLDPTGKKAGRGAYLCDRPACWEKAAKGDALEKALRARLTDEERSMIAAQGAALPPKIEN